jgi:hypothetical protein
MEPFMDVPARAHRAEFECRLEAIESDSPVSLAGAVQDGRFMIRSGSPHVRSPGA